MIVAAVLFALAALMGVLMAIQRFRGAPQPPFGLAVVHGLAAASGLVALVVAFLGGRTAGTATAALVLFLVAALGGIILLAMHLQKKPLSIPLIGIHGAAAVTAFVLLLVAIVRTTG